MPSPCLRVETSPERLSRVDGAAGEGRALAVAAAGGGRSLRVFTEPVPSAHSRNREAHGVRSAGWREGPPGNPGSPQGGTTEPAGG